MGERRRRNRGKDHVVHIGGAGRISLHNNAVSRRLARFVPRRIVKRPPARRRPPGEHFGNRDLIRQEPAVRENVGVGEPVVVIVERYGTIGIRQPLTLIFGEIRAVKPVS